MGSTNVLLRKDKVDTSSDNQETTLLKEEHQDHHLQPLDIALATKIATSSSSDSIVTKALAAMNDDTGEPWIPWTNKEDWIFEHSHLYFKIDCMFSKWSAPILWKLFMNLPLEDMKDFSTLSIECKGTTGSQECQPFYEDLYLDMPIVKLLKQILTPWYPD